MSIIPKDLCDKLPGWMAEFMEVTACNRLLDQINYGRTTTVESAFMQAVDEYLSAVIADEQEKLLGGLLEVLSQHYGEVRDISEKPVETLQRIIRERDAAKAEVEILKASTQL